MNTHAGHAGENKRPPFKIMGTNAALQDFERLCMSRGLRVSSLNSYFRPDFEHCLMPCYAYDNKQPDNIFLQTICAVGGYQTKIVYRLPADADLALAMTEVINQDA